MSVISAAEADPADLADAEIPVPALAAVRAPAPGPAPAGAGRRHPRSGRPAPRVTELRVRQLQVSARQVTWRAAGDPAAPDSDGVMQPGLQQAAVVSRVSLARVGQLRAGELRASELRVSELTVARATASRVAARPGYPVRRQEPRPAPVRLTRRGRAVVTIATVLAACAAALVLWLVAAGGAQASSHGLPDGAGLRGMTRVVVEPGQTLWAIAAAAEPTANTQTVVQQIISANALTGSAIYAGQQLWVPRA